MLLAQEIIIAMYQKHCNRGRHRCRARSIVRHRVRFICRDHSSRGTWTTGSASNIPENPAAIDLVLTNNLLYAFVTAFKTTFVGRKDLVH